MKRFRNWRRLMAGHPPQRGARGPSRRAKYQGCVVLAVLPTAARASDSRATAMTSLRRPSTARAEDLPARASRVLERGKEADAVRHPYPAGGVRQGPCAGARGRPRVPTVGKGVHQRCSGVGRTGQGPRGRGHHRRGIRMAAGQRRANARLAKVRSGQRRGCGRRCRAGFRGDQGAGRGGGYWWAWAAVAFRRFAVRGDAAWARFWRVVGPTVTVARSSSALAVGEASHRGR